jgi:hypothetical protein
MAPQLNCPRCGYTRRLGERGLSVRVATCPKCPDRVPLTFTRAADLPFEEPGDLPPAWRAGPRSRTDR